MTIHDSEGKEMDLVDELRERLKDEMDPAMYADTDYLTRFLRARNYDLKAAENMLRTHINWRKINRVDTILTWYTPLEVTKNHLTLNQVGHDKEGSPILLIDFGTLDTKGLIKSIKPSEALNYCVQILENVTADMKVESAKRKTKVEKFMVILNFDNFSLAEATSKQGLVEVSKLFSMYEANYPERLKVAFAINTSWLFTFVYAVLKPILSGTTLQKLKIFGIDGWQEELLKLIDADVLPAFLGGNLRDPDGNPRCHSFLAIGGPVPEKYFAFNNKRTLVNQPGVKNVTIHRLAKVRIEMNVIHPDSDIEWEFETKGRDIAFSLLYVEDKDSKMQLKVVIPKQRIDTSISPEEGLYKCNKSGTYILEFDNSYSWFHQKDVYYKTQIISPVNHSLAV